MSRFRTGLVVGKFTPLHLGHELVIRTALSRSDCVIALSYTNPEFPGCEPARRREWLALRFPLVTAVVLSVDDGPIPANTDSAETHRAFCAEVLRRRKLLPIDAIFSSEDYGDAFAADLAVRQGGPVAHVSVDPRRTQIPISGTALRADLAACRPFVADEVYTSLVGRKAPP